MASKTDVAAIEKLMETVKEMPDEIVTILALGVEWLEEASEDLYMLPHIADTVNDLDQELDKIWEERNLDQFKWDY